MIEKVAIILSDFGRRAGPKPQHHNGSSEMSYILDALKKAERREQRRKTPISGTFKYRIGSPEWPVQMVSPNRLVRFRPEAAKRGLAKALAFPRAAVIAVALLGVLAAIECALVYDVRTRLAAITTDVNRLTKEIGEKEARKTKMERERLSLKLENDSLRKELEVVGTDLKRSRGNLQTLKAKQKRQAPGQKQSTSAQKKKPGQIPGQVPAAWVAPPRTTDAPPARADTSSRPSATETATAKVYSIR